MSMFGTVFFIAGACFSVAFAMGTVSSSNPLRAALCLLGYIVSLAGIYLSLSAELMAAIQLLVYAGAVVVLFIFTIMLLGPSAKEEIAEYNSDSAGQAYGSKAIIFAFVAMITLTLAGGVVGYRRYLPAVCPSGNPDCGFGGVEAVGASLFQKAAVPFELVSITLLVAIVGAIAVAKGRTLEEKQAFSNKKSLEEEKKKQANEKAKLLSEEVAAYEGH